LKFHLEENLGNEDATKKFVEINDVYEVLVEKEI
jgi:DnaJ-class molecular chaperone